MFDFAYEVAVKVCGVTSVDDALACAAAGADMIGLNFSSRSARCITAAAAAPIVTAVRAQFPAVKLIGVFVDQADAEVRKISSDLGLDAVQLHGAESPDEVRALALPCVIKALRVADDSSTATALAYECDAILLDTWSKDAPGGTGETFPWSIAAALRPQLPRLILAGGLTSDNVAEAIRTVRPWAVDVCSGVESAPGQKDEARVRAFLAAVKELNDEKTAIRT